MAGGMRFNRGWDFNPGNKQLDLNSLTQDAEVIEVLQNAIAGAMIEAENVPFTPAAGIASVNVQDAIEELVVDVQALVNTAVANLLDGAPGALDTLNELAAAINDDAAFSTTVLNAIAAKTDIEQVLDYLGTTGIVEGVGIDVVYDDVAGTLTFSVAGGVGLDAEGVMDLLGTTGLVEGAGIDLTYDDGAGTLTIAQKASGQPEVLMISVSDETTALTAGVAKTTFRMPFAMNVTEVRANLNTVSSAGGPVTVDINEGGATILSTKLTIDDGEKTSVTAAAAAVISDGALADDAEITIDIDDEGTGAKGLKVTLIGTRA